MPNKPTKSRGKSQGKNAPALEKETKAEYRASLREHARQKREFEKLKRNAAKARDKELSAVLKRASAIGLYSPKSPELTSYRRKRARQIEREFRDLLDPTKTLVVNIPPKASAKERRALRERSERIGMKTTRKTILVPADKHTWASLKHDKKHNEYYVERRGKTKRGKNKGRIYRDHIPLAEEYEIDKERARLRRAWKRLTPLKDNERIAFRVTGFGYDGYSRNVYSSLELLLADLAKYHALAAEKQLQFFRSVILEKTSSVQQWEMEHPTRSPGEKHRPNLRKQNRVRPGKHSTRKSKG